MPHYGGTFFETMGWLEAGDDVPTIGGSGGEWTDIHRRYKTHREALEAHTAMVQACRISEGFHRADTLAELTRVIDEVAA